ncbi:YlbE-like family protein [Bacillus sp. FJAT-49732]|uniref:YlbE-like family protein n=1 Tax=Lederbergia citrisecunda TaxID=2833583 RepID=A0A942TJM4_9BACI|nr:YlbE-like family protein [Lederbergia citrisecunda]MBS4198835.1 YlbE-like family protein [Lederbergia citrisecunda]
MRQEVLQYIHSKNELRQFIREQPYWYRKLSREPESLQQFEIASLHYFKRTIPHQVEKFSNGLQMASMMMGMLQSLKAN